MGFFQSFEGKRLKIAYVQIRKGIKSLSLLILSLLKANHLWGCGCITPLMLVINFFKTDVVCSTQQVMLLWVVTHLFLRWFLTFDGKVWFRFSCQFAFSTLKQKALELHSSCKTLHCSSSVIGFTGVVKLDICLWSQHGGLQYSLEEMLINHLPIYCCGSPQRKKKNNTRLIWNKRKDY